MSKDNANKLRRNRVLNRRNAIQTFGIAGGSLLFPYGKIASVASNEYTGESVIKKASPKNPLSSEEVREVQAEAIQTFKNKTGSSEAIGSVAPGEDTATIAVGFHVGPKTGASVYLGTIPKNADLSSGLLADRHQKAAEHVREARDKNRSHTAVARASSSGSSDPSGWDTDVASYFIDYDDEPYGSLYDGGTVYERSTTDEWIYGIDHVHRPNPGANAFSGSSVDLVESICRHKWGAFDAGYITPHDYFPSTDDSGDFTVSGEAGFLTAVIGVEYNPPEIYRTTKAEPNGTDDFYWNWEHPTTTSSDHTFRPVSIARSYDRATSSTSGSNRLFKLYTFAEWDTADITDRDIFVYVD